MPNNENNEKYVLILDTNILHPSKNKTLDMSELPLKKYDDAVSMIEINDIVDYVEIFIPEVVLLELANQHWDKINNRINNLKKLGEEFEKVYNIEIKIHEDFNPKTHIEKIKDEIFENVNCIPVPENRETLFNEIFKMSLDKMPPFEQNGDKGFKDALILLSIIYFAKNREDTEYIFFSQDKIFKNNKDILEEFFNEETGKNLKIEETNDVQRYISDKFELLKDFREYLSNTFYPEVYSKINEIEFIKFKKEEDIFNQISDQEIEINLSFSFKFEDDTIDSLNELDVKVIFTKKSNEWVNDFNFSSLLENFIKMRNQNSII